MTGWSEGRAARGATGLGLIVFLTGACARAPREPFLTYFNADYGVSLRYPASWKADQAEKDGVFYRYFLGPAEGQEKKPGVSVTFLAGPLGGTLDDYAKVYLEGRTVASSQEEARGAARGRSYSFASAEGADRYALLLLQESGRVYGLYGQGPKAAFERHAPTIAEMIKSLALERAETYGETRNQKFGFAVRTPPSWQETRSFSGAGGYFVQWTSPAIGADKSGQTVHASLTLSVESLGTDTSLQGFYDATRRKLGDSFEVLSHKPWKDGLADVLRTETPIATSRVKRFYRVASSRGYTLAFEARDDVFSRISRWCDIIAGTLQIGVEMAEPK